MSKPSKTTVLIADDDPNLRLLVTATIQADGFEIVDAADGDEAWILLQRHKPRLALLDVQMPGRTGVELARAIKKNLALTNTYVVLLTALAQTKDMEAGLAAGADMYLTKPFSPLELLTLVERVVGLE